MLKITQVDQVTRIDSARSIGGRGYYWSTAYLVDGLLIDTGCAHTAPELAKAIDGQQLNFIANTHSHEDHIGANGLLQQAQPGLEIFAHPAALPVLADPRKTQYLQLYRRVMWGWPQPSSAQSLQDGAVLQTSNHRFQVIYTPGHSPDHICLHEPDQGWLFSGDLFIGGKDRALRADNNIWLIIDSLKKMADLPLSRLFPGCARVRENPSQILWEKISYLEEMGGKVHKLHEKGWPIGKIARKLFGGPMSIELVTSGQFSRRRLVESYLSKL